MRINYEKCLYDLTISISNRLVYEQYCCRAHSKPETRKSYDIVKKNIKKYLCDLMNTKFQMNKKFPIGYCLKTKESIICQDVIDPKQLNYIAFGTLTRCNWGCPNCGAKYYGKSGLTIEEEINFTCELISCLKEYKNIFGLQLTNAGEIDEYYKYYDQIINTILDNKNITNIDVLTNGYNTEKIVDFINKLKKTKLNLEVGISFYSLNREVYKRLTGVDALNNVVNTIKTITCKNKRLQIIVFKETIDEVYKIIDWALNKMNCSSIYLITNCYDMSIQKFTHELYDKYKNDNRVWVEGHIQTKKTKGLLI